MKELIIKKLKEKSTWAGLAAFVLSLTFIPHYTEISTVITAAGGFVIAVLGIFFPETEISNKSEE